MATGGQYDAVHRIEYGGIKLTGCGEIVRLANECCGRAVSDCRVRRCRAWDDGRSANGPTMRRRISSICSSTKFFTLRSQGGDVVPRYAGEHRACAGMLPYA